MLAGSANRLSRLCYAISFFVVLASVLLLYAPVESQSESSQVAAAVTKHSSNELLIFTPYSELEGKRRGNLFGFEEITRAEVKWQQPAETRPVVSAPVEVAEPVAPPAPRPDVEGLELIGTVAGTSRSFAMILDTRPGDSQSGGQQPITNVFNRGDKIRNATLAEVLPDRIVLTLGSESAVLTLPDTSGNAGNATPVAMKPSQKTTNQQSIPRSTARSQANTQPSPSQDRPRTYSQSNTEPKKEKARLGLAGRFIKGYGLKKYGLKAPALQVTAVEVADGAVQSGDVVVYINNQQFSSSSDLLSIVEDKFSGDTIVVRILRDEKPMTVEYKLP